MDPRSADPVRSFSAERMDAGYGWLGGITRDPGLGRGRQGASGLVVDRTEKAGADKADHKRGIEKDQHCIDAHGSETSNR